VTALLALLLASAPLAPDGTPPMRAEPVICWWFDLGALTEREVVARRPPQLAAAQGWGIWSVYARGGVRLDVRNRLGWWVGSWTREPWVEDPPDTGAWRRLGIALEPWLHGEVMACAHAGSAYLWGSEHRAWGTPYTSAPFAALCASPGVEVCR
jgi:hypothetical protein